MKQVVTQGLESTIHSFDGCFVARFDPSSPSASISLNAWGAAIDVNADTNRFGSPPAQDPASGGADGGVGLRVGRRPGSCPDGMHFGYASTAGQSLMAPRPIVEGSRYQAHVCTCSGAGRLRAPGS